MAAFCVKIAQSLQNRPNFGKKFQNHNTGPLICQQDGLGRTGRSGNGFCYRRVLRARTIGRFLLAAVLPDPMLNIAGWPAPGGAGEPKAGAEGLAPNENPAVGAAPENKIIDIL
jgi:hypothetical protein